MIEMIPIEVAADDWHPVGPAVGAVGVAGYRSLYCTAAGTVPDAAATGKQYYFVKRSDLYRLLCSSPYVMFIRYKYSLISYITPAASADSFDLLSVHMKEYASGQTRILVADLS